MKYLLLDKWVLVLIEQRTKYSKVNCCAPGWANQWQLPDCNLRMPFSQFFPYAFPSMHCYKGRIFIVPRNSRYSCRCSVWQKKCIKTGHFEDNKHKDRGSCEGFCLVFCLSLLKDSVEVREDSRVLLGGIHLSFYRSLPEQCFQIQQKIVLT